ncbi:MAG: hypothetical protein ACRCV9_13200 [Burkholderiaceae bacterium]
MLAGIRLEVIAGVVDVAFRLVIETNDTPGVYACQNAGGSVTFTKVGATRQITANNCTLTFAGIGDVRLISGSVATSNATTLVANGATYLNTGDFVIGSLNVDWTAGPETYLGNVSVARQADLRVQGTGRLVVNRNGRDDQYNNLSYSSTTPGTNNAVSLATIGLNVASPRIGFGFAANIDATYVRATAADNSAVRVGGGANSDVLAYDVFSNYSATAVPEFSTSILSNDAGVTAAIQRWLQ